MLTYGIPPEFRGGVHLFVLNRQGPSGQSRVYRVTQLRTDGVPCRESTGTGSVNLKVVPNECCLGRSHMDQLICAVLSHTHYWYEVGTLKVPAICGVSIGIMLRLALPEPPWRTEKRPDQKMPLIQGKFTKTRVPAREEKISV